MLITTYNKASPTTQTIDELIPCSTQATTISQYADASMRRTWELMRATKPDSRGVRFDWYFSDSHAITGVAEDDMSSKHLELTAN
jgi:hypothetical protein